MSRARKTAALPTALVAASARTFTRTPKRRSGGIHLPGRPDLSGLPGLRHRKASTRRHRLVKLAGQAGTILSGASLAAEVLSQLASLNHESSNHRGEPE